MNERFIMGIVIIIVAVVIYFIAENQNARKRDNNENNIKTKDNKEPDIYPYEKKNILTKAEYSFYMTIRPLCDMYNIIICPKVRLEDIAEVKKDTDNKLKYRGYVKSRHIDFMLCDNKLHILAGLELDDNTHKNNVDQIKSDNFKNKLFETIGLTLFRVKMSEGDYTAQFNNILKALGYIKTGDTISLTNTTSNS